jgi:hypothetical protein
MESTEREVAGSYVKEDKWETAVMETAECEVAAMVAAECEVATMEAAEREVTGTEVRVAERVSVGCGMESTEREEAGSNAKEAKWETAVMETAECEVAAMEAAEREAVGTLMKADELVSAGYEIGSAVNTRPMNTTETTHIEARDKTTENHNQRRRGRQGQWIEGREQGTTMEGDNAGVDPLKYDAEYKNTLQAPPARTDGIQQTQHNKTTTTTLTYDELRNNAGVDPLKYDAEYKNTLQAPPARTDGIQRTRQNKTTTATHTYDREVHRMVKEGDRRRRMNRESTTAAPTMATNKNNKDQC